MACGVYLFLENLDFFTKLGKEAFTEQSELAFEVDSWPLRPGFCSMAIAGKYKDICLMGIRHCSETWISCGSWRNRCHGVLEEHTRLD